MMSSTFGAPLGGTMRGAHQAFDSMAFCLITPPNLGSGAGSWLPLMVVVAPGEPGMPEVCWALRSTPPPKSVPETQAPQRAAPDIDHNSNIVHAYRPSLSQRNRTKWRSIDCSHQRHAAHQCTMRHPMVKSTASAAGGCETAAICMPCRQHYEARLHMHARRSRQVRSRVNCAASRVDACSWTVHGPPSSVRPAPPRTARKHGTTCSRAWPSDCERTWARSRTPHGSSP